MGDGGGGSGDGGISDVKGLLCFDKQEEAIGSALAIELSSHPAGLKTLHHVYYILSRLGSTSPSRPPLSPDDVLLFLYGCRCSPPALSLLGQIERPQQ